MGSRPKAAVEKTPPTSLTDAQRAEIDEQRAETNSTRRATVPALEELL